SDIAAALARYGKLDVLSCAYRYGRLDEKGEWVAQGEKNNLTEAGGVISGAAMLVGLYRSGRNLVCNSYSAVCRREFLLEHRLRQDENLRLFEDNEWLPRVLFAAERVGALDKPCYRYIRRRNSLSTTLNGSALLSVAESSRKLAEFFDDNYENMGRDVRRFWSNHTLNGFLWYYFNLRYRSRFTWSERRAARRACRLFTGRIGWRLFCSATPKKRLAWPLFAL
ncbi:MAG: hypothetical protein PHI35_09315, partial [Victivallaceae bacterium]|nr:hypothetical protein [Victivallaceae bacterium]